MVNQTKAFPTGTGWNHEGNWVGCDHEGMDLRDYFAAKAMQGNIASCPTGDYLDIVLCAKWAYEMADAMMKARGIDNERQV
jgi:hypothetical protein